MPKISLQQAMLLVAIACQWFAVIGAASRREPAPIFGGSDETWLAGLTTVCALLVGNVVGCCCASRGLGLHSRLLGMFIGGLLAPATILTAILARNAWVALGIAGAAVVGTFYVTRPKKSRSDSIAAAGIVPNGHSGASAPSFGPSPVCNRCAGDLECGDNRRPSEGADMSGS